LILKKLLAFNGFRSPFRYKGRYKVAIPMTSLTRAKNGDWFARKGIPESIRPAYKAAFGVSQEERFRRPATLPVGQAKQEFRDWDAEITSRIERIKAQQTGGGISLTFREAHGLAGQWYGWFIAQHEDEPGEASHWDIEHSQWEDARTRFAGVEEASEEPIDEHPNVRRYVRDVLTERARVATFLAGKRIVLSPEGMERFLDVLGPEYSAALAALRRRSQGDYSPSKREEKFPDFQPKVLAGMTCWTVFEAWVKERNPAASTVNRWRSVFKALEARFAGRDIAEISAEDARDWKETLVTPERSAVVVNGIWLRAAGVVFGWAADNKKISGNPFEGIRVAVPKTAPKVREREFTEEEWQTILRATLAEPPARMAQYNAAARRWVPWLCAYTGSRPGEMTQLRGDDVKQHKHGFWFIRITPEAGTVKGGSARTVPVHEHLVEQGFAAFVKKAGSGPLFYDPAAQRAKTTEATDPKKAPWVKAREKLADWVRDLGVSDAAISPNHAWRHTFKRRAARAGIEKRIRFGMCGHSSRDVGDDYETPTVEDLAVEMKRFPRYGLEEKAKAA
jgi:integrase